MSIMELPDCYYPIPPINITPCAPTPNHTLHLNNLDDEFYKKFIPYVYIFKKSVGIDTLKSSLSRVLVDYYPFAGRFRTSTKDENKLVVDCNGEGALFVEASMDITVEELLKSSMMPNSSWKKIIYNMESKNAVDTPLLIIQVTNLRCGGMILCASINHSLSDGTGASQFLNAWGQLTQKPDSNLTIIPSHDRQVLNIQESSQVNFTHPIYIKEPTHPNSETNLTTWFLTQSLVPTSFIFRFDEILRLKKQCTTSSFNHITSFEAITAHLWRSLVKATNLSLSRTVKLCFTVNFRKKMKLLPKGYYGNGFVLAGVESIVKDLVAANNLDHGVKLVQNAKASVDEEYIKSTIDVVKDKKVIHDGSISLYVTQWNRLGLEDVDFGEGKPLHLGPLSVQIYCVFLPVIGDPNAVRVLLSVPKNIVEKFQHYMIEIECWGKDE
ncbi:hypothetical protein P8452_01133 [Trifolium repens]|nr:hypothetical protein P8452_01133 [Trifolium repens]